MPGGLRESIRQAAPALTADIDALAGKWVKSLTDKISDGSNIEFRPKQINDPVWGTIELLPWEVALLDTPLLQRMRGVRQLGLAHLVFPGACHGRLEHIIGVVGAIEETTRALTRQIERWNRNNSEHQIRTITDPERYAIRLAGLLHDVGHGPFSHALEPVLETEAPLGEAAGDPEWRKGLQKVRTVLVSQFELNKPPSTSEIIAVLIVNSDALQQILASDKIVTARGQTSESLVNAITAAIIGALKGPGAMFLSGIVSSQIDADKLDYMVRDAHHAGLEIGFDTSRLLAKLEVLRIRAEHLDGSAMELRQRAAEAPEGVFLQVGIAASGFGSFEQMLIGRTFLYDRLYHHHKVRAAEAMAQRLLLVAERDRGERLSLKEVFLSVDDETLLRILAQEVTHSDLAVDSKAVAELARGILDRNLLHRAFAFRGRFIALPPGMEPEAAEQTQNTQWGQIVKDLDSLKARFDLGKEIHSLALLCCETIKQANVAAQQMARFTQLLEFFGPEQIIVDLPASKAAEGIKILARYPNGAIRVPEFSFNPQKWADAYDLQKRTGYVFCPRDVAPIIGLASKIVFLTSFGVIMAEEADGYIKATPAPPDWLPPLIKANVIDEAAVERLTSKRHSLIALRAQDLKLPQGWLQDDPDLAARLVGDIQKYLKGGLTSEHLFAFQKVMGGIYTFVDMWYSGSRITGTLKNESELQTALRESLETQHIAIAEGSAVGGGRLDLLAENAILIENKFSSSVAAPASLAAGAGMQGRRYAIALNAQIVIVVIAYNLSGKQVPNKPNCLSVKPVATADRNRVEIRFEIPFGGKVPSASEPESKIS